MRIGHHENKTALIEGSRRNLRTSNSNSDRYVYMVDNDGHPIPIEDSRSHYSKSPHFHQNNRHLEAEKKERNHLRGHKVFALDEFYPLETHFFAGLLLPTPKSSALSKHYDLSACVAGAWNHRFEKGSDWAIKVFQFDCCLMSRYLTFQYRLISESDPNIQLEVIMQNKTAVHLSRRYRSKENGTDELISEGYLSLESSIVNDADAGANAGIDDVMNGIQSIVVSEPNNLSKEKLSLVYTARNRYITRSNQASLMLPSPAFEIDYIEQIWGLDTKKQQLWSTSEGSIGVEYTTEIPNLNHIEIHNSPYQIYNIYGDQYHYMHHQSDSKCSESSVESLKVVEFNAERGTKWLETALKFSSDEYLKDADIIILNEMDIGMARSGNHHTTRLLAYALGLNFAWGLEFVELTNGDQKEQVCCDV